MASRSFPSGDTVRLLRTLDYFRLGFRDSWSLQTTALSYRSTHSQLVPKANPTLALTLCPNPKSIPNQTPTISNMLTWRRVDCRIQLHTLPPEPDLFNLGQSVDKILLKFSNRTCVISSVYTKFLHSLFVRVYADSCLYTWRKQQCYNHAVTMVVPWYLNHGKTMMRLPWLKNGNYSKVPELFGSGMYHIAIILIRLYLI